jgi:hypothetical protein
MSIDFLGVAQAFVKQSVAHTLIADHELLTIEKAHDPLNQASARQNDFGAFRFQSRNFFSLGYRSLAE